MQPSNQVALIRSKGVKIARVASVLVGAVVIDGGAVASAAPKGVEINMAYPVLAKEASALKGQRITHTACIFQFDSNTGTKDFLAEWTNLGYNTWDDLVNVRLPNASVGAQAFQ